MLSIRRLLQPPILVVVHKEIDNAGACVVSCNVLVLGLPEMQQGQPDVLNLFL
jgi:hypothetical protein